jgi:hypothetical protein
MTDSSMTPNESATSGALIAKGLIENLPVIIDGLKEVYALRTKEQAFQAALQARCAELQINRQNFAALVQGLTELSKSDGSDEATKAMYREMIRSLFDLFATRSRDSGTFSEFMNS